MQFQPLISSSQNAWVKSMLRLHQASHRREQRKFLIEGSHLVEEAVAAGWPLESICFTEEWAAQHRDWLSESTQRKALEKLTLQPLSHENMKRLSTTDTPCAVIGIAQQPANDSQIELTDLRIAVESLQDPGNLGALIRISAASGAQPIVLSPDSVDPTNPKVLRSTAGQWFRSTPIITDLKDYVLQERAKGVQVLAAAADGDSFWDCDLKKPTLFLLGNEGSGISSSLRALADTSAAIPMAPGVESLNVAVAGALLVYEAQRQRNRRF